MSTDHALVFTFDRTASAPPPSVDTSYPALHGVPAPDDCGRFELFMPHPEHARLTLFGDGPPPFTIIECHAATPQALQRLAGDAQLRSALHAVGAAGECRAGLFRVLREPVPAPRADDAAPLSLVVHYYGPVDDAAGFAAHYVAHHPPILARLPGVREVLCYVPAGVALPGLRADPTVIRNEVRFDSMDALLDALASPVLAELRADSKTFPRFGRSTHYPMTRQAFTDAGRQAPSRSPAAGAGR
ncbi:MAG: hypothetical protein KJ011_08795 [Burkholderiaceae bacterium]|nr:hypothetical protein [Burkholderiaceae bacterium]